MMRYRRVRHCGRQAERHCTPSSRKASTSSLASGTTMLATKTSAARNHEPSCHRKTTPDRMVSSCTPNSDPDLITGSTLAGT